jgi:hypothetical protein
MARIYHCFLVITPKLLPNHIPGCPSYKAMASIYNKSNKRFESIHKKQLTLFSLFVVLFDKRNS